MSARSFRSVGWVAGVAATALGCYMVNLKVASERATLEDVETRIVLAERDIRLLQTEIGTRGRLAQLEKWNVKVLALSAPAANQFMEGSFQLATLAAPQKVLDPAAPVVLASAPAPVRQPVLASDGPTAQPAEPSRPVDLLHTASLKAPVASAATPAPKPGKVVEKPAPAEKKTATLAKAEAKPAKPVIAAKAKVAAAPVQAAAKPKPKVETKSAATTAKPKPKSEAKTATTKPTAKEAKARQ